MTQKNTAPTACRADAPSESAVARLARTSASTPTRRIGATLAILLITSLGVRVALSQYGSPQEAGSTPAANQMSTSPATQESSTASDAPRALPQIDPKAQFMAQRGTATDPLPPGNPLNGARAYRYLQDICAIGRRVSGSPGMKQQQELLKKHFESLGGKVTMQEFQAKHPKTGEPVPMANMIVTWHPDRKDRILLCAHYDTRPFPDRDPDPVKQREGPFIGANDGASGVAVMMELAHILPRMEGKFGVDFVLFDGEELVFAEVGDYFLGSEYFAKQYVQHPPEFKYRWGVLMDMVGGTDLQLFQEQHSWSWPDTRPLVTQIWSMAQRLGVKEFIPRRKHDVLDDHLALHNTAKIPTCDIIDFDYPQWHTADDLPKNCSGESLAKVGWVIYEWSKRAN